MSIPHFRRVTIAVVILSAHLGVHSEESAPVAKPSVAESIVGEISSQLHRHLIKSVGWGDIGSADQNDQKLGDAVDKLFREIFLLKGGSAFTQRKLGGHKRPIQLNGLELAAPSNLPITEADKLNGIECRTHYSIRAKAWREYVEGSWSEWKPSKPNFLSGFTFQKKSGKWEVQSSPRTYYSLR